MHIKIEVRSTYNNREVKNNIRLNIITKELDKDSENKDITNSTNL